jgi:hypothetical protein
MKSIGASLDYSRALPRSSQSTRAATSCGPSFDAPAGAGLLKASPEHERHKALTSKPFG